MNEAKQKELKLRDRIYIKRYSRIESIQTIIRITPTMAKSKDYSFDKEVAESGYVRIKTSEKFQTSSGYLEDEELKKEWENQKLNNWWNKRINEGFTIRQIKEIKKLIK